jgi:DnaK suppressor protein
VKSQPARSQPAKAQPVKSQPVKSQPVKSQPGKSSQTKLPQTKSPQTKSPPAKAQTAKPQPVEARAHPAKPQPAKTKLEPKSGASNATATKASELRSGTKAPARVQARPRPDRAFYEKQRQLLLEERDQYLQSAEALKAQADSLALEHEPGDVQFDEEGGEGGTSNIDREMDLVLSAQARSAAAEIDRALAKIEAGTYGLCEQCGQPIPEARLQALPYAALCVSCKSGGLSARR